MSYFASKSVLVTGGTGMIGQQLCRLLLDEGAKVTVASLDKPDRSIPGTTFKELDLRSFSNCLNVVDNQQIVFHLAGVKGSPKMTAERPASFFVPTLQFSLNMMEASRRSGVENYLVTSSVGVYEPAEIFKEDSVWETFPSPNDKFAGWAKRMCELQAEAYKIEYGWDRISIVRPANVYGPFDNFDPNNAMVIPSLIYRAINEKGPLLVWGDGSRIRDFIHSKDVARGMMKVVELGYNKPVNLGSGSGVYIKEIAEGIASYLGKEIEWDITKPQGDIKRIMDTKLAKSLGIENTISIYEGIKETIEWYKNSFHLPDGRYNSFTEKDLLPDK